MISRRSKSDKSLKWDLMVAEFQRGKTSSVNSQTRKIQKDHQPSGVKEGLASIGSGKFMSASISELVAPVDCFFVFWRFKNCRISSSPAVSSSSAIEGDTDDDLEDDPTWAVNDDNEEEFDTREESEGSLELITRAEP